MTKYKRVLENFAGKAFYNNTKVTGVTVPAGIVAIGNSAFAWCSKLTSITVDTNNANYSSLSGVLFDKNQNVLIQCPGGKTGNYTIPNTVNSIASGAFSCAAISGVTVPDSVHSIGSSAFQSCSLLTSLATGNGVTSIGDYAFYNGSLKSVTIGTSVTSIGNHAFDSCSSFIVHIV